MFETQIIHHGYSLNCFTQTHLNENTYWEADGEKEMEERTETNLIGENTVALLVPTETQPIDAFALIFTQFIAVFKRFVLLVTMTSWENSVVNVMFARSTYRQRCEMTRSWSCARWFEGSSVRQRVVATQLLNEARRMR